MTIRLKLVLLLVMFAMLTAAMSGWHIYGHLREVEEDAVRNAESSAQAFAVSLTFVDETTDIPPIYKSLSGLRDFIYDRKRLLANVEDFVVVDVNRIIIGDTVPEEVGKSFDEEYRGREVELTIRDGVTRTFIEKSAGHPEGIMQLVVPLKTEAGETVGAVIMEYTAYYNKYIVLVKKEIRLILIFSALILLISLGVGYYLAGGIAGNIARLKKATEAMAAGDIEAKAEVRSRDELGDLARSFNSMAVLRQEAEEKVVSAREFFESIITHVQETFYVCDGAMNFTFLSPNCKELYGYVSAEFYKDSELWIKAVYPEDAGIVDVMFQNILKGEKYQLEYRIISRDGVLKWVHDRGASNLDSEGKLKVLYGTVVDITERKKAHDDLKEANERLVEKSATLERFNRVMVGRELEMIKLKAEVNELLEKAGQPKKYEAPDEAGGV